MSQCSGMCTQSTRIFPGVAWTLVIISLCVDFFHTIFRASSLSVYGRSCDHSCHGEATRASDHPISGEASR